jgi:DNA mismatch repair protein MutL
VFGKRLSQDLLPVEVDTTLCRISGFVGKPESARKKGAHNYFFVNGRYMKHSYFHKAVTNAFERLVPQGMQVPYFIYFEVTPAEIDVNIHPTKTEIKFENEQSIWQILLAAVKDAIGRFCEVPTIDFDTEGKPDIPLFNPQAHTVEMPTVSYNPEYNPFKTTGKNSSTGAGNGKIYGSKVSQSYGTQKDWEQLYEVAQGQQRGDGLFPNGQEENVVAPDFLADKSPVHYQYKGRYIMTAVKSGLMIIDQQRADIRIRFERFMEQFRQKTATTQRILFPVVFDFPLSDSVLVDRYIPDLQKMGFDMSSLGGGSYVVNGIPSGLEGLDPERLIRQVVADALEKGGGNTDNIHETLALSMARHAAIPLGQVLSNEEMEQVVDELFACSNVNYTPDGRKILHILPQQDIEQLLGG